MAKIAIVILNYNGLSYLQKFLPIVKKNSGNAEIYIVDNQSTDGSDIFVANEFPEIKLIVLPENLGYAGGYNAGLKTIEAEYFVLLNSDIEVTENWLDPIVKLMDSDLEIAACQPKILDYNHRDLFEYAGAAGGYLDSFGYPFCRGRIFDTIESDEGQYDFKKQIFWASGACFIIRSEVFSELGGFDEDFFAHMEEIDLCWRINLAGRKIFCQPKSVVYHVGGGTLSKSNPQKTYLNFRNNLSMIYKYSIGPEIWMKLLLRFLLDMAAGFKLWQQNSIVHFFAVIRAYFQFWKKISVQNKKRYKYKRLRLNTLEPPLLKGLLPYKYYILGKKSYRDLVN